jgi:rare lipoprotein A (peptidoglycan hydrolase)
MRLMTDLCTSPALRCIAALSLAASLAACAETANDMARPLPAPPPVEAQAGSCAPNFTETGIASWYGPGFHMKATASGEPFDMDDLTAAHRWLPLNTIVRVTNLETGRSAVLRINDRGPYVEGRSLDVSRYAAERLGLKRPGTAAVRIEVFDLGDHPTKFAAAARRQPPAAHFPTIGALLQQR